MNLNPVFAREVRTRFRGKFTMWGITLWLLIICGFGYLAYIAGVALGRDVGQAGNSAFSGRIVFELLLLLLMTGVLVVVPAVAGLSIAIERDRATLPLVQVTQLGPWGLVLGKLTSSIAWVVLLLVAIAPVAAVPVVMGGVGFRDLAKVLMFFLVTVITIGSISVWVSSRAKTLRGAIFGSYLWVFVLVAMTLVGLLGEFFVFPHSNFDRVGPQGREFVSVWLNPYVGLGSVLSEPLEGSSALSSNSGPTLTGATSELFLRRQPDGFRQWWQQTGRGFAAFGGTGFDNDVLLVDRIEHSVRTPLWWRTVFWYLVMSAAALWGAVRSVSAPNGRVRRRQPQIAVTEPVESTHG